MNGIQLKENSENNRRKCNKIAAKWNVKKTKSERQEEMPQIESKTKK